MSFARVGSGRARYNGRPRKTGSCDVIELTPPLPQLTFDRRAVIRDLLPITQFHAFHSDHNISFQLNRFLIPGLEPQFAEIGGKIKNFDDWKSLFLTTATSHEQNGALGPASRLYRAAEFFMSPDDPDRRRAADKFIELFYQINDSDSLQRIRIPYGTGTLHGLRLRPAAPSIGTIVIHAGFDAYIEEFHAIAKAFTLCGYDVVMFDGPGQGSTLMSENMAMTHEWEKPVGAVLDHLGLTDVTLIGISLGGYLAVRAAAFEPRIRRVVAFDVMLDFFQCVTSRRGKLVENALNALVSLKLSTPLNMMAHRLMKRDLYSMWGIKQGMHITGTKSPSEYFFKLKAYHNRDISHGVTQDTLIMAGAEDHFVPLHQFYEQLQLFINARSVTGQIFTRANQAQAHCQIGNLGVAVTQILAWVDTHS
jgi:pimeloyl-ACP methyl ester carboxylesterase